MRQVDASTEVLRSPHMERVPIRELQQHASAVLRRVRAGETVGITDRGTLVAVMTPPSSLGGSAALIASGRVREATGSVAELPPPVKSKLRTADVLDDLRADR
jgi:prevent-host-death family protein